MTQNTDVRRAQLEDEQQALTGFEQEHGEARNNLIQMEYRVRALELYLEQAKSDLSRLEGFSIEGLIYGLLGSKDRRLSDAREKCQEIQQQYDACENDLSALQHKVADLQNQIDAVGDAKEEYESLIASRQAEIEAGAGQSGDERSAQLTKLTEAAAAAQASVANIQKAMATGKAALKDLDDESRVLGLMGRCRVAESGKALKSLMKTSRNSTAKECTSRVQGSIGRFHRQLADAFSKLEPKPELTEIERTIEEIARDLSPDWLRSAGPNGQNTEHVQNQLNAANMLLERELTTAQQQAKTLEDNRNSFIATSN